ncbi:KUP/HAK/KT family potassium transporter, partial [Escherichia coli]
MVAITVLTEQKPWVDDDRRASMTEIGPNFWRVTARYGFLERPDVTHVLELVRTQGCTADLDKATYFVGLETISRREDGKGLPGWVV